MNRLELPRRLREVKTIEKIVGANVGRVERPQGEDFFGEFEDTAEFMLRVRYVVALGVRRDDDQRNAEAELVRVILLGNDVVEPSAPIVPGNEDRRVFPIRALADRIDHRSDPGWSRAVG